MKSKLKRSARHRNSNKATIFCCHGVVYTVTDKVLAANVDSADEILNRLRRIDGVTVTGVRGGVGNIVFPALRLPEVTRVLVPLDSARAPEALVVAAYRGRIW